MFKKMSTTERVLSVVKSNAAPVGGAVLATLVAVVGMSAAINAASGSES